MRRSWAGLERVEERPEGILRWEALPYARNRLELFPRGFWHLEIGLAVHVGRFDALVTEPSGDGGPLTPRLEPRQGR
jgi:hypothetical protein